MIAQRLGRAECNGGRVRVRKRDRRLFIVFRDRLMIMMPMVCVTMMMVMNISQLSPFLMMKRPNPNHHHEGGEELFYEAVPKERHLQRGRLAANSCQDIYPRKPGNVLEASLLEFSVPSRRRQWNIRQSSELMMELTGGNSPVDIAVIGLSKRPP